jgi:hypothetical protein
MTDSKDTLIESVAKIISPHSWKELGKHEWHAPTIENHKWAKQKSIQDAREILALVATSEMLGDKELKQIETQITHERMCINGRWWIPVDGEIANPKREICRVTEREISEAVLRGNIKYWADAKAQDHAYQKWKAANFEGKEPQISQGSLPDYITREVNVVVFNPTEIEVQEGENGGV